MQLFRNVVILLLVTVVYGQRKLKLVAEWNTLDYVFPQQNIRDQAINSGQFIQGNGIPIDVDVDYRDDSSPSRIFVTIPRFTTGIPVTLGYITGSRNLIQAYPNYSWQSSNGTDCNGITSVFRIAIDKCQRLWVMDTGRIGSEQKCSPQILIFNLRNDELIHRYRVPDGQFTPGVSLYINPILDVQDLPPGQCLNTVAYIADVTGFGVLVYNLQLNRSWRTTNKLYYPIPDYGTHTIAGESFELMDGVFGLALTPLQRRDRYLYFHSLASNTENRVSLNVMNNETAWLRNPASMPSEFQVIGRRHTQAIAQAMDRNCNLFFGLEEPIGIACWDSNKPYSRENTRVVVQDNRTLQLASGLKVIENKKGKEELWVMTCRFQKVMTGTMNQQTEVNFRVQALQIDELLYGTKC